MVLVGQRGEPSLFPGSGSSRSIVYAFDLQSREEVRQGRQRFGKVFAICQVQRLELGQLYSGGKQSPAFSDRSKSPSIVSGRSSANFAEVPPVPSSARPRAVHADDQILLQELETLTGTRSRSVNRSERSNANVDVSDTETEYEHAEGRGIETETGEA